MHLKWQLRWEWSNCRREWRHVAGEVFFSSQQILVLLSSDKSLKTFLFNRDSSIWNFLVTNPFSLAAANPFETFLWQISLKLSCYKFMWNFLVTNPFETFLWQILSKLFSPATTNPSESFETGILSFLLLCPRILTESSCTCFYTCIRSS